ncbi:hypothetical protein BUE80_DR006628 [Diplocarpon rosae]|nr:hypothetical protein BUE80_DR006628 [Diplocarpon rosae]
MQFSVVALTVAAMASAAAAVDTVTIYACPSTSSHPPLATGTYTLAGVPHPTGTGVASTGVATAPTATGSPINYATGAAPVHGVSVLGMIIAGGVALFL